MANVRKHYRIAGIACAGQTEYLWRMTVAESLDIRIAKFPGHIPQKKRILLIGIEDYRLLVQELKRKTVKTYKGIKIHLI